VSVNNIARWDGGRWHPLGTGSDNGVDGTVWAMTVYDDGAGPALYVGGDFQHAGGIPAHHFARWDGATWSSPGNGTNGGVFALAEHDDGTGKALYLGGIFTQADGVPANRIARWRGGSLSAVGSGMTGAGAVMVRALASFDGGAGPRLYAGGLFSGPGKNIAQWDGTSWSPVGTGPNAGASSTVNTMTVFDDGGGKDLYVGGWFTSAGGVVDCRRIARWDGTSWTALGTGFGDANVNALSVFDDGDGACLYATGQFTKSGDSPNAPALGRVAKWTSGTPGAWTSMGEGLPDDNRDPCWCGLPDCDCGPRPAVGYAMAARQGELVVGGDFVFVPVEPECLEAFNLVRWRRRPALVSPADLDLDGDVDAGDYRTFAGCLTGAGIGPASTCCLKADLDQDGDVDLGDFGVLQRCYSGGGVPADPACVQ
jgi:hypothetical protein